jgi:hypothetical protein
MTDFGAIFSSILLAVIATAFALMAIRNEQRLRQAAISAAAHAVDVNLACKTPPPRHAAGAFRRMAKTLAKTDPMRSLAAMQLAHAAEAQQ